MRDDLYHTVSYERLWPFIIYCDDDLYHCIFLFNNSTVEGATELKFVPLCSF